MSGAALLAAGAGVAAAGAIVETATALRHRDRRRRAGGSAGLGAAVGRLGRGVGVPAAPSGLAVRMAAAGLPDRLRPADVMAVKVGAGLLGVVLMLPPAAGAALRTALTVLLLGGLAGFFGPDLVLRRRARRRQARAGLELADALDLLRVAVEAGLPLARALGEVGRRRGGVLGGELRACATRMELGAPRAEALDRLRARVPLAELATLTAAMGRADRHGAPLAPTLAALAVEARARRAAALRERAAAAAPRIQLAVALLLVPAVLLLVAAGLVHRLG